MSLFNPPAPARQAPPSLADQAYNTIKQELFDFNLIPGDRFSESAIAERLGMSRTPVRDALSRLQSEGYLEVHFRSGWSVRPFDFERFEHLYDLRMVLETTSIRRLCERAGEPLQRNALDQLKRIWIVARADRLSDGMQVADLDEAFHVALVGAAGNPEMARVHGDVTERIRIIRRLDFTDPKRIHATYAEHAQIVKAIIAGAANEAVTLLQGHIETSKAEVRMITLHRLYRARE